MSDKRLEDMVSKKLIISLLIIITIISFVFVYISFQHPVIGVLYEVEIGRAHV